MRLKRPTLSRWALPLASVLGFGIAGHFAAAAFIHLEQSRQIDELTEVVMRRSEAAIDFAGQSLDELGSRGLVDCQPASLQAIRLHVYQRYAIKDVRLVNKDGSVVCSAYSETLEFDKGWVARSDMLPSRDHQHMLFRVEQFGGDALGVLKDVDSKRALVAILGINASMFDILPAELRAHSEIILALNDGEQLGEFKVDANRRLLQPIDFQRSSASYPLHATIRVENAALAIWNSEVYWPALAAALGIGAVFGFLLARARRVEGPLADLDRALVRGEFKPYFQPIFELATGTIKGCEILARWHREDGSIISPMDFIPLAESSGRIEGMTWQILERALIDLQALLRQDRQFKLSVNIVPSHLLSADFLSTLRRTVAAARVSPRQIIIEVTERKELSDLARAATIVSELRDYGFRVAIDDMGIGHSGLSRLKSLGANTIKIDKFFVDTVAVDTSTAAIIKMLVGLAEGMQMSVVAEGIETTEQVGALIACGVQEGQGYLVAAPLPATKFLELLSAQRAKPQSAAALVA